MHTKPDSERGKLLSDYVLARVTKLDGIDLNNYDFDRHNTLFYFVTNEHGHIYLRYGGRNSHSAEKFLNLDSLSVALEKGLDLFEKNPESGSNKKVGAQVFPSNLRSMNAEVIAKQRCVECHLAEDHLAREKISAGIFEPLWDLYSYPDIELLGLEFDIPRGIFISEVNGNARLAGIEKGDLITHIEGRKVYTYADLQYEYNKLNRYSKILQIQVQRGSETVAITIKLPKQWWKSNLAYKHWSIEPILSFSSKNLLEESKKKLGIKSSEFAVKVEAVEIEAMLYQLHNLKKEDVIYSVNGVSSSELTDELVTYVKLLFTAEENIRLGVIREGEKIEIPLKSLSNRYRKVDSDNAFKLPKLKWSDGVELYSDNGLPIVIRTTSSNGHLFIELSSELKLNLQDLKLKVLGLPAAVIMGEYRGKMYLASPLNEKNKNKVRCHLIGSVLRAKGSLEIDQELSILTDTLQLKSGGMLYLLSQLNSEK